MPFFVAGGVPGFNDSSRLRAAGFFTKLGSHERGIADKGYRGANPGVYVPYSQLQISSANPHEQRRMIRYNQKLESIRAIIEHVNQRLKVFGGLSTTPFSHPWKLHWRFVKLLLNLLVVEFRLHPVQQVPNHNLFP
jgi:hypothetical protein